MLLGFLVDWDPLWFIHWPWVIKDANRQSPICRCSHWNLRFANGFKPWISRCDPPWMTPRPRLQCGRSLWCAGQEPPCGEGGATWIYHDLPGTFFWYLVISTNQYNRVGWCWYVGLIWIDGIWWDGWCREQPIGLVFFFFKYIQQFNIQSSKIDWMMWDSDGQFTVEEAVSLRAGFRRLAGDVEQLLFARAGSEGVRFQLLYVFKLLPRLKPM